MRRALLLAVAAAGLLPAALPPTSGPGGDERPVVFEDVAKQLVFTPPPGWTFGKDSDIDRLVFEGPRSGGRAARVTLLVFEDLREPLEILADMLVEQLGVGDDEIDEVVDALGPWPEAAEQEGVVLAVALERKIERKPRRVGIAIERAHPRVLVVLCEAAPRQFPDLAEDHRRWLQAVGPQPAQVGRPENR